MVKEAKYILGMVLSVCAIVYAVLFAFSHVDKAKRENNPTVSEEQWNEFSETAGCQPVRTNTSWRTTTDGSVTYRDQGTIITYDCEGRSITARRFP